MRKSLITVACLGALLMPAFTACDSPHYVTRDGITYYDANTLSTDSLPSQSYTKGGQYIVNPDTATNTRDNRGNRPQGYGHNVNNDPQPITPSTTVIYPSDGSTTVIQTQ